MSDDKPLLHGRTYSMLEQERCYCGLAWPCPYAKPESPAPSPGEIADLVGEVEDFISVITDDQELDPTPVVRMLTLFVAQMERGAELSKQPGGPMPAPSPACPNCMILREERAQAEEQEQGLAEEVRTLKAKMLGMERAAREEGYTVGAVGGAVPAPSPDLDPLLLALREIETDGAGWSRLLDRALAALRILHSGHAKCLCTCPVDLEACPILAEAARALRGESK
jgi:hypothetical protein